MSKPTIHFSKANLPSSFLYPVLLRKRPTCQTKASKMRGHLGSAFETVRQMTFASHSRSATAADRAERRPRRRRTSCFKSTQWLLRSGDGIEKGREREGICMAMADADADGAAEQIALLSVDRWRGGWGRGTQAIFFQ